MEILIIYDALQQKSDSIPIYPKFFQMGLNFGIFLFFIYYSRRVDNELIAQVTEKFNNFASPVNLSLLFKSSRYKSFEIAFSKRWRY